MKHKSADIIDLYNDASPELRRILNRKLGNIHEAEEVAHDAFEKLCKIAQRQDIEDLRKYFFTMANRMALNVLRRRNLERDYVLNQENLQKSDFQVNGSSFDPETIAKANEKLRRAKQAMIMLPPKTRHVFLMHRFQDFTYSEIAEQLNLSIKSVEYHMNRALNAVISATCGD